jgi:hypothetical protein
VAYAYRKAIIKVDQPGFVNCERLVPLLAPRFRFRSPKASKPDGGFCAKATAPKKSWNDEYEVQLCQEMKEGYSEHVGKE